MPVIAISRTNCARKQKHSVKGLKFGDLQNLVDGAISAGVTEDDQTCGNLNNMPSSESLANAMQHGTLVADHEISEHQEDDVDNIMEEVTEESDDEISSEDDNEGYTVAVEIRADEVVIVEEEAAQPLVQGCTTRSSSLSKLYNCVTNFLEVAHIQ